MSKSKIFTYTGSEQTYIIPDEIYTIHVELNGSSGGKGSFGGAGGMGGNVNANLNVTPGSVLYLYIGGTGTDGVSQSNAQSNANIPGGYNGGGNSGSFGDQGGSGAGATDIRINGNGLSHRILVAGGGGGGGSDPQGGGGGNGNGQPGADGAKTGNQKGGKGGTQNGGGLGGSNLSNNEISWGKDGVLGTGGMGGITGLSGFDSGGGGGGGYYGGGGGAASTDISPGDAAGGGGGSSYAYELANDVEFKQGIHNGLGNITISYVVPNVICFVANTMIRTDQGDVPIQLIKSKRHTIHGSPVVGITKTIHNEKELVLFEKNALGDNVPNRETIMSRKHKIIVRGKYVKAECMINDSTIRLVPYDETLMYNIVMHTHNVVRANNIKAETLHPRNNVAILFKNHIWKKNPTMTTKSNI